jgi:hypothetical protein
MDDFDKFFNRMQAGIFVVWALCAIFSCGFLGFVIWITVKLLQFLGVM